MANDRDLISKEDHELNYVLKKWGKKQSTSNRKLLADMLDKFNDDDSVTAHNRDNFYKYAENKNLIKTFEDAESEPSLTIVEDDDKPKAKTKTKKEQSPVTVASDSKPIPPKEKKSSKGLLWIILIVIAIIIIILIILFGLKNCSNVKPQTVTTTVEKPDQNDEINQKLAEEAAKKAEDEKITKINALIKQFTPVYFVMDKSVLLPGEDKKINQIISGLKEFKGFTLYLDGHTAKIGESENEMKLSVERAEKVKSMIEKSLPDLNISYSVKGYGSEIELYPNTDKAKWQFNRRVEIKCGSKL